MKKSYAEPTWEVFSVKENANGWLYTYYYYYY